MRTDTALVGEDQRVAESKVRTLRVDDDLWTLAAVVTARKRDTNSGVMKRGLAEYVEEHATEEDRRKAAELATEKGR